MVTAITCLAPFVSLRFISSTARHCWAVPCVPLARRPREALQLQSEVLRSTKQNKTYQDGRPANWTVIRQCKGRPAGHAGNILLSSCLESVVAAYHLRLSLPFVFIFLFLYRQPVTVQ